MHEVTQIIHAIEHGDMQASEKLLPLVYDELRLLAAQKLSHEPPGQTLQATALVHEAYLRLIGSEKAGWDGRNHFFAAAAEAMRRILVENARRKKSRRYGGSLKRVKHLESLPNKDKTLSPDDLLALHDALEKLEINEPGVAKLVEIYYFAGLTLDQAAQVHGISRRTAGKYLAYARAWLHREITEDD